MVLEGVWKVGTPPQADIRMPILWQGLTSGATSASTNPRE